MGTQTRRACESCRTTGQQVTVTALLPITRAKETIRCLTSLTDITQGAGAETPITRVNAACDEAMKLQGRTARRTDGQKENLEPKRGDVERHPVSKHTLIALLALQYFQPNKIFSHNLPEDRQQSVSSWVAPAASACQANMHTETQNTHAVGSVSPSIFVFISIDLLVFKLAVHTHASSSCCIYPRSGEKPR